MNIYAILFFLFIILHSITFNRTLVVNVSIIAIFVYYNYYYRKQETNLVDDLEEYADFSPILKDDSIKEKYTTFLNQLSEHNRISYEKAKITRRNMMNELLSASMNMTNDKHSEGAYLKIVGKLDKTTKALMSKHYKEITDIMIERPGDPQASNEANKMDLIL